MKRIALALVGFCFSMLLCIFSLEIGIRLTGPLSLFLQVQRNKVALGEKNTFRILCYGDSTTALGGAYSWPYQLEEILNKRNVGIKCSVLNKAAVGLDLAMILGRLEGDLNTYNPKMVIVIGMPSRGYPELFHDKFVSIKQKADYFMHKPQRNHFFNKFKIYKALRNILYGFQDSIEPIEQEDILQVKTENSLKQNIKDDPRNGSGYITLAVWYRDQGKLSEVEKLLKKAIDLNSRNAVAYAELGEYYTLKGKYIQAEELFKKAVGIGNIGSWTWFRLGEFYKVTGKYALAEEALNEGIKMNIQQGVIDVIPYFALARCYDAEGKITQAEEVFKKAATLSPKGYIELAGYYEEKGRFSQAEEILQKAISLNLGEKLNRLAYLSLSDLCSKTGKPELLQEYTQKLKNLGFEGTGNFYEKSTYNFLKIKEHLDKRRIKLLGVALNTNYEVLKKIYKRMEGAISVNAGEIIKEKVRNEGYSKYYVDSYYSHFTPTGHRVIAEIIADTILNEYFYK